MQGLFNIDYCDYWIMFDMFPIRVQQNFPKWLAGFNRVSICYHSSEFNLSVRETILLPTFIFSLGWKNCEKIMDST